VKYRDNHYDGIVHVNNGLPIDRYTFHQGGQWGFSTGLTVQKPDGGFLVNSFVRLATQWKESQARWYDSLLLGENHRLFLELFPDFHYKRNNPASESDDLGNPVLLITLVKGDSLLAEAFLPVSQESEVGGFHVTFPEVRFWSQFEIVYDPGLKILYVGFFFVIAGLTMRLLSVRKIFALIIMENHSGSTFILSGSSEKFQDSFEAELRTLYGRIACKLREAESKEVNTMSVGNERIMEPCT
jgi:cytochrome c biogenesis protein ResB